MTDIVERLRATSDRYGPASVGASGPMLEAAEEIERLRAAISDWGAKYGEARGEIERLRAANEWQGRALQLNSEDIERLTRERDAALDALAKSVERINDYVTEIKLWENDIG